MKMKGKDSSVCPSCGELLSLGHLRFGSEQATWVKGKYDLKSLFSRRVPLLMKACANCGHCELKLGVMRKK